MSKVNNNQCKFCFEEALKKGMIGKNNGLEIIANVNAWVNIYVSFVSYYFTFPVAYQVNKLDRKLLREESWQHFLLMRRLNFSIMRHATYFIRLSWHFFCVFITTFFAKQIFATNYIYISTQRSSNTLWCGLPCTTNMQQFETHVSLSCKLSYLPLFL